MLEKILLSGVGLALLGLARFAFNAVAINVFSEEVAGALNIGLSLAILAALPVTTLLGATTVRFIASARGEGSEARATWLFRRLFSAATVITVLTMSALYLGREWIAADRGVEVWLVGEALLIAAAYGLYQFFRNVLYAVDRVGLYSRLELVAAIAFFGVLGVSAVNGVQEGLLLAFVAGYGTFAVVAMIAERHRLFAPGEPMPMGPLVTFSLYALVGSTASLGVREIAILVAPDRVDFAGVAHLGLCVSLLTPLQFMPRMLRTVVFAQSAEQAGRGDSDALAQSISEVSHWLLIANVPLCTALILVAEPVLTLIGGTPSDANLAVLRVLTLGALVDIMATPATNALPGAGNIRVPAISAIAGLVAAVAIWALPLGAIGLAGGLLASSLVKGGIPVLVARSTLKLSVTRTPVIAGAMIAASVIAFGAVELTGAPIVVCASYLAVAAVLASRSVRSAVL